jgi:hypothetical protein
MTRRRDGIRERKCGCLYYDYGPPVLCGKHEAKAQIAEEKQVRKAAREVGEGLGHEFTRWAEYLTSYCTGKWTCYCVKCGLILIVYDDPPAVGDQIAGWALTQRCKKSELVSLDTPSEEVADGSQ